MGLFDLVASFLVGLVGSLHCIGMCGPLILAYSLYLKEPADQAHPALFYAGLFHHVFFHLGRIISYGFLGALGAGLFYLIDVGLFFSNLRAGLSVLGGAVMILIGMVLLRVIPVPFLSGEASSGGSFWKKSVASLVSSRRVGAKMALGVATGFLPCGLSWAMIAKAATTRDVAIGFLTMALFGLGTVPTLLATGLSASFLSLRVRLIGERVSALAVIVMGVILICKGGRALV